MTQKAIKTVFVVATLSILLLPTYPFGGQAYHEFAIGTHGIDGNKIEFTFPMPPPSKIFYLFTHQWKLNSPCKRARLVVNLYNKTKDLIGAGESMWANMKNDSTPYGHMTFGSVIIKGVSPDNINDVIYFSVYLQKPPGKNLTVLNDSRPEVRFARDVMSAVIQGEEAYLTLFAGHPLSPPQKKAAGTEYDFLKNAIRENPHIDSVLPMKPSDAVSIRYSCPEPFDMTFGPRYEESETAPDGGKTSLRITLSLPIGKVNGQWRLLLPK